MLSTGARNPNITETLGQRQIFDSKDVNIMAVMQQYCIKYILNILNCSEVGSTLNFNLKFINVEVVLQ